MPSGDRAGANTAPETHRALRMARAVEPCKRVRAAAPLRKASVPFAETEKSQDVVGGPHHVVGQGDGLAVHSKSPRVERLGHQVPPPDKENVAGSRVEGLGFGVHQLAPLRRVQRRQVDGALVEGVRRARKTKCRPSGRKLGKTWVSPIPLPASLRTRGCLRRPRPGRSIHRSSSRGEWCPGGSHPRTDPFVLQIVTPGPRRAQPLESAFADERHEAAVPRPDELALCPRFRAADAPRGSRGAAPRRGHSSDGSGNARLRPSGERRW